MKPSKPQEGHNRQFDGTGGSYVNFYHTSYRQQAISNSNDTPFGLLDVVDYSAEAELFGGVTPYPTAEEASSSSKDDPLSANKRDQ